MKVLYDCEPDGHVQQTRDEERSRDHELDMERSLELAQPQRLGIRRCQVHAVDRVGYRIGHRAHELLDLVADERVEEDRDALEQEEPVRAEAVRHWVRCRTEHADEHEPKHRQHTGREAHEQQAVRCTRHRHAHVDSIDRFHEYRVLELEVEHPADRQQHRGPQHTKVEQVVRGRIAREVRDIGPCEAAQVPPADLGTQHAEQQRREHDARGNNRREPTQLLERDRRVERLHVKQSPQSSSLAGCALAALRGLRLRENERMTLLECLTPIRSVSQSVAVTQGAL